MGCGILSQVQEQPFSGSSQSFGSVQGLNAKIDFQFILKKA